MLKHEQKFQELEGALSALKAQTAEGGDWASEDIVNLEKKLQKVKEQVYSELTPWARVEICRHPQRPRSTDYIKNMCESFTELFGDRLYRDDRSIIAGLGVIKGTKFVIVAQEKGCDTESRLHRNFGMPHPEGYRKALRMMKLAAKFNLPVLSLLDTPGAYPGLAAEERGQGWAIANNLFEMASLQTPIIIVLIGEGCSGGALGMGIGDAVGMLEHAYYSVISPEGCASILWRDSSKNETAAASLKMHAEDLKEMGIIDAIIEEPPGGAHLGPKIVYQNVSDYILKQAASLKQLSLEELLMKRHQKFRKIGAFKIENRE